LLINSVASADAFYVVEGCANHQKTEIYLPLKFIPALEQRIQIHLNPLHPGLGGHFPLGTLVVFTCFGFETIEGAGQWKKTGRSVWVKLELFSSVSGRKQQGSLLALQSLCMHHPSCVWAGRTEHLCLCCCCASPGCNPLLPTPGRNRLQQRKVMGRHEGHFCHQIDICLQPNGTELGNLLQQALSWRD